jgi:predicted transcriptional regulator of viral defense system
VTDKRLPKIRAGRSSIVFYYRRDLGAVTGALEDSKTDTGRMRISCLELTLLDLLRYPHAGGGFDTIASVIAELGGRVDANRLATLSASFERSVAQRLGYLLDRCGHQGRTAALHHAVVQNSLVPWIELDPTQASDRDFRAQPTERNKRWRVIVRRPPQPDA